MTGARGPSPFNDLRKALDGRAGPVDRVEEPATRIDPCRQARTGIPEVVHAGSKSPGDVIEALRQLAVANGRALASRVPNEHITEIRAGLEPALVVEEYPVARALVASRPGSTRSILDGAVGILSAGTSDIPIASEAALIAMEMGVAVHVAWDVGVAGLHRLVEPLERFASAHVDVVVVAAGMDGALPAVVAGLVDVPVIGLPTSTGYGFGGGGIGALTTMLQSCAPGLVVVNIDNGIGAGATAALIASRAARLRTPRGG